MSSFYVSSLHIATIAAYAALDMKLDPVKVAASLQSLNNASVRALYGGSPKRFGSDILTETKTLTLQDKKTAALNMGLNRLAAFGGASARAAYVYRLCECLDYQGAEASQDHPARKLLHSILLHSNMSGRDSLARFSNVWSI